MPPRPAPLFEGSTVSTNGTRVEEAHLAELARLGVELQISIDSPRPAAHDAIRGDGVFAKATQTARRAVAAGVHTILSMVYARDTLVDFEAFLDFADGLGVAEARFIPMRQIGAGLEHRHLVPDQRLAFDRLLEVLARRASLRRLLRRDFFSIQMALCRFATTRTSCGIGRNVVFLDADGAVYPCPNHVDPAFRAGSLAHERLDDILLASPVMARVRDEYHVDRFERCRDCPFARWCAGECRGEVRALTGRSDLPSPHCAELVAIFEEMMWLIADGDARLGTRPPAGHLG